MSRLVSIDALRGITIAAMIIVNNQGDWGRVFKPLRHAAWHGITPADLIFPFFIFVMGISISLSLHGRPDSQTQKSAVMIRILQRTLILLFLGLLLNVMAILPGLDFEKFRIPGVLQRIALCYFFAASAALYLSTKARVILTAGLLSASWFLLAYITPDGFGRMALTPDENIFRYIDSFVFGAHTYVHAPAAGFDPEGLPGTITAAATALFGVFAGGAIARHGISGKLILWFLAAAAIATAVGLAAHSCMPINKNLWTPTYTVFTAGLALASTAVLVYLIEIINFKRWAAPFIWPGANAILIYVLSSAAGRLSIILKVSLESGNSVTLKAALYQTLFSSWPYPYAASLAYALLHLFLWTGFACLLYHKKIFFKV